MAEKNELVSLAMQLVNGRPYGPFNPSIESVIEFAEKRFIDLNEEEAKFLVESCRDYLDYNSYMTLEDLEYWILDRDRRNV